MAQTINVNTTPGQFMPTLYYSQGDIGREFEIVLASSDGWSIPAGATVEMVATKPSGFGFSVAGTLTDNVASFTTTETMTNEHGRYPAEIRITSGTDVIGTANFYLSGERDPHPAETIDGDASEIMPELTLLVERVEAAASSVLDMTVNASTLSAGSQATYSYDEETNTATFGIPQGEAGAGAAGVTASAYSSSRTYAVGDYVIHNSNLYRCTTAITTAEAFTAAHWTQVVLADDVSDVKSEINEKFPIIPLETSFFKDVNYAVPSNVEFTHIWPNTSGVIQSAGSSTNSIIIHNIEPNTYYSFASHQNRFVAVQSSDDSFVVGNTYTKLTGTVISYFLDGTSVVYGVQTEANAKSLLIYFYSGEFDYDANKNNIYLQKGKWNPYRTPVLPLSMVEHNGTAFVAPKDTDFFADVNYFNSSTAEFYEDRYVDGNGIVQKINGDIGTLLVPVMPNTVYWMNIPSRNRGLVIESASVPELGETYTLIYSDANDSTPFTFTTGNNARYVEIYFYSGGTYDYESNKANIVLNRDIYSGLNAQPYIPSKYLPSDFGSSLDGANILIFGDSITDTCSITVNSSDETTAYAWRNPSNSYVDGGGQTITFSMWPKILKESQRCGEIRNYALSGASYKTSARTAGNERQNLQYQIDIALNDLDNPNDVFAVDEYVPDIVIFALGTNDGASNDTYESAMQATVYKSDNVSIDVDATISALDETKFCESVRKAYMRIKKAFPMAQIYVVLPIQRADGDENFNSHEYLMEMAERYSAIVIDGRATTGITRDFNVWNGLGTYLKDGLHPNEKGQNLMAKAIISSLKTHYMPFSSGFNQ